MLSVSRRGLTDGRWSSPSGRSESLSPCRNSDVTFEFDSSQRLKKGPPEMGHVRTSQRFPRRAGSQGRGE